MHCCRERNSTRYDLLNNLSPAKEFHNIKLIKLNKKLPSVVKKDMFYDHLDLLQSFFYKEKVKTCTWFFKSLKIMLYNKLSWQTFLSALYANMTAMCTAYLFFLSLNFFQWYLFTWEVITSLLIFHMLWISLKGYIFSFTVKYCKRFIFSVYDIWRNINFWLFSVDLNWRFILINLIIPK